jgi:hypothetical protein
MLPEPMCDKSSDISNPQFRKACFPQENGPGVHQLAAGILERFMLKSVSGYLYREWSACPWGPAPTPQACVDQRWSVRSAAVNGRCYCGGRGGGRQDAHALPHRMPIIVGSGPASHVDHPSHAH